MTTFNFDEDEADSRSEDTTMALPPTMVHPWIASNASRLAPWTERARRAALVLRFHFGTDSLEAFAFDMDTRLPLLTFLRGDYHGVFDANLRAYEDCGGDPVACAALDVALSPQNAGRTLLALAITLEPPRQRTVNRRDVKAYADRIRHVLGELGMSRCLDTLSSDDLRRLHSDGWHWSNLELLEKFDV